MKTALTQVLDELDLVPADKPTDYIMGVMKAIKVIEKFLPTEKEQITTAFREGQLTEKFSEQKTKEDYFTQTFNTPTNENSN